MGKLVLESLKDIIDRNKDVMVEDNIIGSDFSTISGKEVLIVKIEPMMYYKILTPKENARLSYIFAENDFITSGRNPEYALIDFESPYGEMNNYLMFMEEIYEIMREKNIKLASAHTGEYSNVKEGITGSIVLITFEKPLFSVKKITKDSTIFLMGYIGMEYKYFEDRLNGKRSEIKEEDLSIRGIIDKIKEFNGEIEYIHDLAEGGLIRAMSELSYLASTGLKISYEDAIGLVSPGVSRLGKSIFSVSSSGAAIISVPNKYSRAFREFTGKKAAEIKKVEKGIWIGDMEMNVGKDRLSDLLKKS